MPLSCDGFLFSESFYCLNPRAPGAGMRLEGPSGASKRRQFLFPSDSSYSLKSGFFYLWITYSTVTDFAKLRGWSTSVPLSTAT
ncbi:hypothetical protein PS861_03651 [Pseudomonas fluorescens]|nr:hypothetical protein PS861_03651 [Pseudomonas fluorescens]